MCGRRTGIARRRGAHPFFVALNSYTADDPDPLTWLRGRWAEDGHGLETFDTVRREGRLLLMADALNEVGHHRDLGARLDRWRDMLPPRQGREPGGVHLPDTGYRCRSEQPGGAGAAGRGAAAFR